jgi:hypothetical protein
VSDTPLYRKVQKGHVPGEDLYPEARRRYLVAVDRDVLARVQRLARLRGVSSESLVNLLLEQRLQEVESQAAKA